MDPEKALEFVRNGSTLLLLDVPQYTLLGVDTQVFSVGPMFMGIKMIPPGVHFVYYCSSSRDREFSPAVGFYFESAPSEVVVRKWNTQEERLVRVSDEEGERFSEAVKRLEFDRQLGPYTLTEYGKWKQLSSYITKDIIGSIEPIGGEITIACESRLVDTMPKTTKEKALTEQLRNSKFAKSFDKDDRRSCFYTQIPRVIKQKGIGGVELTSMNMDKTHLLESILVKEYEGNEDRLLGELQFAFIAFLMGQSLEAFLQWKSLVTLLFGCTEAPFHTRSQLFAKFIRVIYYQLKYGVQKDHDQNKGIESVLLDDSWFSADNFLYYLCKDFFSLINEASVVDGDLLTWTRKLKELLENTLGWVFNPNNGIDGLHFDEDDEFAPVVEMISEQELEECSAT
ncbi:hypothetical protein V2J09_012627 [Rumex salicifolius]